MAQPTTSASRATAPTSGTTSKGTTTGDGHDDLGSRLRHELHRRRRRGQGSRQPFGQGDGHCGHRVVPRRLASADRSREPHCGQPDRQLTRPLLVGFHRRHGGDRLPPQSRRRRGRHDHGDVLQLRRARLRHGVFTRRGGRSTQRATPRSARRSRRRRLPAPTRQAPRRAGEPGRRPATPPPVSRHLGGAATDNVGVTGYGTYLGATSKGTTTATATTISGLLLRHELHRRRRRGRRSRQPLGQGHAHRNNGVVPRRLAGADCADQSGDVGHDGELADTLVDGGDRRHRGHRLHPLPRCEPGGNHLRLDIEYTFGSLACGSSYTLGVEALDAVGHVSTRSTLVANTASCGPTSTTFVDAADAYVSSTTNTNNGSQTALKVKQSNPTETAYLKFNVSGLAGARPERHPARLRQLRHGLGLRRLHHHLQLDRNRPQLHGTPPPAPPNSAASPPATSPAGSASTSPPPSPATAPTASPSSAPTGKKSRSPARETGANAPQLLHHHKRHTPTTRHPTPNPTHQPHRHQHHHNRQPHLDHRHRQHRRHRLQPLPLDDGRVHARGGQPDRATDVDRVRGHGPGRRHLLLPRDRT